MGDSKLGYLAFALLFFSILATWKCYYSSIMWSCLSSYSDLKFRFFKVLEILGWRINISLAWTEPLYDILVAWKWDFSMVMIPSIHKACLRSFGGLKMNSSRFMRQFAKKYVASVEQHHFGGLKKAIPAVSLNPAINGNWLSSKFWQL